MSKKTVTVEELEEEVKPEPKNTPRCGHVNKQYYNENGKPEDLACTLAKGHKGDHQATGKTNFPDPLYDERGRVVKTNYIVQDMEVYWGDMAGTPAADITEEPILQMSMFQKDLVMKVLQQNPAMDVKQAIARAKMSKEWNAASA